MDRCLHSKIVNLAHATDRRVPMHNRTAGSADFVIMRHAAQLLLACRPLLLVVNNVLFNRNASPAHPSSHSHIGANPAQPQK